MNFDLKKMPDEELVALYIGGSDSAFAVLLKRYEASIYSFIFILIHKREVVEDIFQDTFMKAIVTLKQGRYMETGRFKSWIMRIAYNLAMDYYRKERFVCSVSCDDVGLDLLNNIGLCGGTIEDELVYSEVLSEVKSIVNYLPCEQRDVLRMRYYQNMSFNEISQITGVSINTALGRVRYAILNMRRMVSKNKMNLDLSRCAAQSS